MPAAYRLSAATGLHLGDRAHQQDQVRVFAHRRAAGCVLAVVADGMGGLSGGRKAADQVMLVAQQLFEAYAPGPQAAHRLLTQLVEQSHLMIRLTAVTAREQPHSTLAAFLVDPGLACHLVHAGDSRVHHFRDGALRHRTADHSYVQELVEAGILPPEEAQDHPDAHLLTGCLGAAAEPPLVLHTLQLAPGDAVLACSDGLWQHVGEREMAALVHSLPAREAGTALVQRARDRAAGRGDNVSLALVRVDLPA